MQCRQAQDGRGQGRLSSLDGVLWSLKEAVRRAGTAEPAGRCSAEELLVMS